jgi:hypothetical protein
LGASKLADKTIGIKLDVRQTGLKQMDDSLAEISKNLTTMDGTVNKENTKGWGSSSQTKEMREQLRYLQQIAEIQARISRMQAPNGSSSQTGSGQGSLPPRSNRARSDSSSNSRESRDVTQFASMLGKLGSMLAGVNILSTIASSLGRGDQLSAGYGDINKRMGGASNGGLSYAKNSTRGLNGYGFDDLQAMQATGSYSQVTGRMDANKLTDQMKTIFGTARRFGMSDPSQAMSSFSSAFSSGVTGGSGAQMNPKEFADLLANAVASGRMQGKEGKMLEQIAQVTQMSVQSMGRAGNEKTIASFLAMGNASGNQAMINKLPDMIGGINQGISSPSGGYGAQALTMRAIGGGKMDYWKEQYIQSQGAFGQDEDKNGVKFGATNVEKVTNQLMSTFKGDKYKTAMMIGQQFNMTPADAMNYVNTYTKDGKFDSKKLNATSSSLSNTPSAVPETDTDRYRNEQIAKQTAFDAKFGEGSVPIRSGMSGAIASVIDSPVGSAVAVGALGLMGLSSAHSLYKGFKMVKGAVTLGGKFFGRGAVTGAGVESSSVGANAGSRSVSSIVTATEEGLPSRASRIADTGIKGMSKSLLRKLGLGGAVAMGAYNIATSDDKPRALVEEGGGLAGAWAGAEAGATGGAMAGGAIGAFFGGIGAVPGAAIGGFLGGIGGSIGGYWGGKKIAKSIVGSKSPNATGSPAYDSSMFPDPAFSTSPASSPESSGSTSGAELVPIVISTILALQPYMGQIRGLLGADSKVQTIPSGSVNSNTTHAFGGVPSPSSSGLSLASYRGESSRTVSMSGGSSVSSMSGGSGNHNAFIQKMLPYANKSSQETGLPVDYILGQWGLESGWGTSDASKRNNNFAGIKPWKGKSAGANKTYAGYGSIDEFASGYSNFYNSNDRYKGLLDAAKGGASSDELAKIIGTTGYAEDKSYSKKLTDTIHGVGKPDYGSHAPMSGGLATPTGGKLVINGGSINVNIKTDNGAVKTIKAPITAEYHGLASA